MRGRSNALRRIERISYDSTSTYKPHHRALYVAGGRVDKVQTGRGKGRHHMHGHGSRSVAARILQHKGAVAGGKEPGPPDGIAYLRVAQHIGIGGAT